MNWRKLNAELNQLTEDQVRALLDVELMHFKRATFVQRLHQRYCALRATRERAEYMASIGAGAQEA